MQFIPHQCGGERGCSLHYAQPEHNLPFFPGIAEEAPRRLSGKVFRQDNAANHGGGNQPALRVLYQSLQIYQHPHRDEKEGDKYRIADKLNPVHQRAVLGNEPVEGKTRQKCSDYGLHPRVMGGIAEGAHGTQDKKELCAAIFAVVAEKPPAQPGYTPPARGHQRRKTGQNLHPEQGGKGHPFGGVRNYRQYHKRHDIRNDGGPDGDGDRFTAYNTEFVGHRKGQQGMGREHARQENGFGPFHVEYTAAEKSSQALGDDKGQQAEDQAAVAGLDELWQVNLQSGKKHDVQQAYGTEKHDGGVTFKKACPVGS
ncbi:MAG: hypothetical protein BWX80_03921 [Candidatus Hydrogenedentes bacterium ADurb.Bin101]|nr:MAG: hypothetical protein BWX80_03921 [Candidatus Hydrogenedentes bacterium ADurb.Bin101]